MGLPVDHATQAQTKAAGRTEASPHTEIFLLPDVTFHHVLSFVTTKQD